MSGTQPYRSEDDPSAQADDASRSLYGAPRAVPRPGEETAETADDGPAPLGSVAPLSMDSGSEEAVVNLGADEPPAPRPAPRPALRLADDPDDAPALATPGDTGLGNRPAQGARVVSASEMFGEGFLGQEGASDFLGLDTEFDPTPVEATGGLELAEAPAPAALAMEDVPPIDSGYVSPLSPPDADSAYAPLGAGDFDDDLPAESFEDELAHEIRPRRSKAKVLGAVLVLGAAAAAAFVVGPRWLGGEAEPEPVEVAVRPKPTRPAPEDAPLVAEQPAPRPIEEFVPSPIAGEETEVELAPLASEVDPLIADVDAPADLEPPVEAEGADLEPLPSATELAGGPTDEQLTLERILELSGRRESFLGQNASMLDLVWRGEVVPIEAIASPSRILTPAVGNVRVTMQSADAFEGRLFAVGEEKVWLDLSLGRIGLDGTAVTKIERLVGAPGADGVVNPAEVVSGAYVRAQVPGGVIYGRVKSRDGSLVTLVTESGARITLDDPVIQETGSGRMVAIKH